MKQAIIAAAAAVMLVSGIAYAGNISSPQAKQVPIDEALAAERQQATYDDKDVPAPSARPDCVTLSVTWPDTEEVQAYLLERPIARHVVRDRTGDINPSSIASCNRGMEPPVQGHSGRPGETQVVTHYGQTAEMRLPATGRPTLIYVADCALGGVFRAVVVLNSDADVMLEHDPHAPAPDEARCTHIAERKWDKRH